MGRRHLFHNGRIVAGGRIFKGFVLTDGEFISSVGEGNPPADIETDETTDLNGNLLMPGVIDDQVHFRDPGLTHKGDINSESRAAAAGGVTSFMDMPNTMPQTVTEEALMAKMKRAAETSYVNYAFWPGATNDNIDFLRNIDRHDIPGVKVFLGASTGNMLVDSEKALDDIFSLPHIIAIHSEDEHIIRLNREKYASLYPDGVPVEMHPLIRSTEACVSSTDKAIRRAQRLGTRLHLLHISTADELQLIKDANKTARKPITSEVCVHHLWFDDSAYQRLGAKVKWNPAIKTSADRDALRHGVADGTISIVATDHAPHLPSEKEGDALHAASGGPLVQHSLLMMLELSSQGHFSLPTVAEMMSQRPARLFGIDRRGEIREGFYADLVVVSDNATTKVDDSSILYKCGWSPLEGETLSHRIFQTYVNGALTYDHERGTIFTGAAMPLKFSFAN